MFCCQVGIVPAVGIWLQPDATGNPGLGPSIYALVAATALGLVVSCFRWLIVDFLLPLMNAEPIEIAPVLKFAIIATLVILGIVYEEIRLRVA